MVCGLPKHTHVRHEFIEARDTLFTFQDATAGYFELAFLPSLNHTDEPPVERAIERTDVHAEQSGNSVAIWMVNSAGGWLTTPA